MDISAVQDAIINPDQDTFYRSGNTIINGLRTYLSADQNDWPYLRFPISNLANIESAYLVLENILNEISNTTIYGITTDTWDETTMNGINAPTDYSSQLDTVEIIGSGYYAWDVTSFVATQTDGFVSLAIETFLITGRSLFLSKEYGIEDQQPKLTINGTLFQTYREPGPLTNTITSTQTQTKTITETVREVTSTHYTTNITYRTILERITNTIEFTITKTENVTNQKSEVKVTLFWIIPVLLIPIIKSKRRV